MLWGMDDTRNQTRGPEREGMFQTSDGAVYRVVRSQAGRLYAKRLNESGGFSYASAAIAKITEDDRMTLEQAAAWGRRFGFCAWCGRVLTDPASIAAGIGPVCAKGEDGRWSSAERAAAKVALGWDEAEAEKREARSEQMVANAKADPEPTPEPEQTGTLTIEDGTATLVSAYDAEAVAVTRTIPGRKWDASRKVNTFPVNTTTAVLLAEMVERFGYEVVGDLPDPSEVRAEVEQRKVASAATDAEVEVELGGELMPFQRAGVAYAAANPGTLIGDDMGLGKTVQALGTIEATGSYPALVVVPAFVKPVWAAHVATWLPGRTCAVLEGRKADAAKLAGADVVIVNYDVLAGWREVFEQAGFEILVADESHYLKNGKAQRTKAVKALARKIDRKLLMTGTPVMNRPVELIAQLDVLGKLDEFGGFWGFAKRYCGAFNDGYGWDLSGATNLDELHDRLRATCMIRRTKAQVLTELPAKRRAMVPIEMASREAYRRVEADLRVWLQERAERQGLNTDEAAKAEAASFQAERLVKIEALKQTAVREKMAGVTAWVEDFLASDRKLVLFATHRETVQILAAHFGAEAITGEMPVAARAEAVERFQNDPEVRLIVATVAAGGVGITLTAASDVAFVELPWRPGDLDQAEDRCHRIGQNDSVTAWYLLAADSIETEIADMLDEKRGVIEATTDGREVASHSIMAALTAALLRHGEGEAA